MKMKLSNLAKILIPLALLAIGSGTALAGSCMSVSGDTLATIIAAGSCSIGDLTFSNFSFTATPGNDGLEDSNPDPTAANTSAMTIDFRRVHGWHNGWMG